MIPNSEQDPVYSASFALVLGFRKYLYITEELLKYLTQYHPSE